MDKTSRKLIAFGAGVAGSVALALIRSWLRKRPRMIQVRLA